MLLQEESTVPLMKRLRQDICLCGRCHKRLSSRAQDLSALSTRLRAASFRAREAGDMRRAKAYAEHAKAAREEAKECSQLALVTRSPMLERVVRILSTIVALVASPECVRLPKKWATKFA